MQLWWVTEAHVTYTVTQWPVFEMLKCDQFRHFEKIWQQIFGKRSTIFAIFRLLGKHPLEVTAALATFWARLWKIGPLFIQTLGSMRCTDWQFLVTVTVPKDGKYYFRAFIKQLQVSSAILLTTFRLIVELFSGRRWRLVSAQVVDRSWRTLTKLVWLLGLYEPLSPFTEELHGLIFTLPNFS